MSTHDEALDADEDDVDLGPTQHVTPRDLQLERIRLYLADIAVRRRHGGGATYAARINDDFAWIDRILGNIKREGYQEVHDEFLQRLAKVAEDVPDFWDHVEAQQEAGDAEYARLVSELREPPTAKLETRADDERKLTPRDLQLTEIAAYLRLIAAHFKQSSDPTHAAGVKQNFAQIDAILSDIATGPSDASHFDLMRDVAEAARDVPEFWGHVSAQREGARPHYRRFETGLVAAWTSLGMGSRGGELGTSGP